VSCCHDFHCNARELEKPRIGSVPSPHQRGAIGLAVLATIAAERTGSLREHGDAALQALNGGYHLAYIVGTALVGVAAVTALATLRPDASGAAPRESRDVLGDAAYSEGA
jgi:hypothetical protein